MRPGVGRVRERRTVVRPLRRGTLRSVHAVFTQYVYIYRMPARNTATVSNVRYEDSILNAILVPAGTSGATRSALVDFSRCPASQCSSRWRVRWRGRRGAVKDFYPRELSQKAERRERRRRYLLRASQLGDGKVRRVRATPDAAATVAPAVTWQLWRRLRGGHLIEGDPLRRSASSTDAPTHLK